MSRNFHNLVALYATGGATKWLTFWKHHPKVETISSRPIQHHMQLQCIIILRLYHFRWEKNILACFRRCNGRVWNRRRVSHRNGTKVIAPLSIKGKHKNTIFVSIFCLWGLKVIFLTINPQSVMELEIFTCGKYRLKVPFLKFLSYTLSYT